MCIAFPGKVVEINGHKIKVEYPHETRVVLLGDETLNVGDYVLVQMGIVIKVVSQDEAKESLKAWTV